MRIPDVVALEFLDHSGPGLTFKTEPVLDPVIGNAEGIQIRRAVEFLDPKDPGRSFEIVRFLRAPYQVIPRVRCVSKLIHSKRHFVSCFATWHVCFASFNRCEQVLHGVID